MQSFNYGEFAIIKSQAGLNSYKLRVKEWTEKTNALSDTRQTLMKNIICMRRDLLRQEFQL